MAEQKSSDNEATNPPQERGFTYGYVEDQARPFGDEPEPPRPATPPVAAPAPIPQQQATNPWDESAKSPAQPAEKSAWDRTPKRTAPKHRNPRVIADKSLPDGWPVGSFTSYQKAQQAVDALSDTGDFPVTEISIVGVDLREVENVVGRLSWGKVLGRGALSGAWMGLFFGVLISLFNNTVIAPMIMGLGLGVVFGLISAAVPYALTRGQRDFATTKEIVAGRYDIVCTPEYAPQARDIIARSVTS